MFSDLLDRKQATLAYINIDLKKSKTLHFFKGVSVKECLLKIGNLVFFRF